MKDDLKQIRRVAAATWRGNDSRVILREREVLLFRLHAYADQLEGLRSSIREVERKREKVQAQIDGLTRVLDERTKAL